ncbi:MAG: type II and III secretion system protein [Lentisphaerae bacterium]|nr:type II and III secretion system protein [Lentisphaerota bacterium]
MEYHNMSCFKGMLWKITAVAAAFSCLCGTEECRSEESINSFLASEPVKKTPEYLAQGERNVQSVAAQLKQLMEPLPPGAKKIVTPLPKPDFTIIPGSNGRSTLIYRCRYIQANRASVIAIENMLRNGSVEFHTEQNLLTIYDSSENIENLKNALLAIDKPMPQVVVEVKVIEVMFLDGMNRNLSVSYNDSKKGTNALGENVLHNSTAGVTNNSLSGSSEAAGLNLNWFPYVSGSESLQTSFQWVLSGQDAKVLSAPNLVISRNEEASLSTGQDIPIQEMSTTSSGTNIATTFRRVGVTLTLTPMIINDNLVTLRVAPEVSTVQQYQKINQGYDASTGEAISFQVPVISIRNLDTTLTLRDGEVIMMGGLYSNRTSMQEDRTPLLSDLPYLGELFTAKNREQEIVQLVFFMRVHILRPVENPSGIVFDPDEVANTSSAVGDILQNSPAFPKLKSTLEQLREEFIDEPERRRKANDMELNKEREKAAAAAENKPAAANSK